MQKVPAFPCVPQCLISVASRSHGSPVAQYSWRFGTCQSFATSNEAAQNMASGTSEGTQLMTDAADEPAGNPDVAANARELSDPTERARVLGRGCASRATSTERSVHTSTIRTFFREYLEPFVKGAEPACRDASRPDCLSPSCLPFVFREISGPWMLQHPSRFDALIACGGGRFTSARKSLRKAVILNLCLWSRQEP